MAKVTQKNRPVGVSSPLGDDTLLFRGMSAHEHLGRLFQFDLDLLSEDDQIKIPDILGQNMAVRLALPGNKTRYFNGFVSRFSHLGGEGEYAHYQATLRPWLWFLTRTSDCRIFQEMTVPDIIKDVFREHGFSDLLEEALSGSYRTWTYCVQYRETDFNFVSRLMEQEGIYYYFKHKESKHVLVLADSISAHEPYPDYEAIPFYPKVDDAPTEDRDRFFDWSLAQEVQSGTYAINDYDFEKPKADLAVKSTISRDHSQAEYEMYDYPGEYLETSDGDNYVRTRIEELHSQYEEVQGTANARGLMTGALFKLTDSPREDQNREYLITSARYDLTMDTYGTGGGGDGPSFGCSITAIESKQPYRSPRVTSKPVVQGPQTAMVVGKSGEEIWTDRYGRVKVQFHWDRYGKLDENSSCWVRVANVWAGKSWGGIQIPRIGQEVIIEFLEGDPDHPIITGRVYNADNMPPYDLPANQTQSGLKSRSTKEGSGENFNEIRFEDLKGEEEVYIHAEKDHNQVTENDRTEDVGHDRSLKVGNDKSENVGNDKSISVGKNHSESVGDSMTLSVANDRTMSIGADLTESVDGAMTLSVSKNRSMSVTKDLTESVDGEMSLTVAKDRSSSIGKDLTLDVGKDTKISIGGDKSQEVAKKYILKAKSISIEADDQLEIKVGKAQLKFKKNGDITMDGKKITVKGSGDVILKGSKITQN